MKKILKWVFPAFLGIVPAMGMDSSGDDASWLNKKGVIYSISEVYEDDPRIMAIVDATFEDGTSKQLHVKAAFTLTGWSNNDEGLYAQRMGKALVFSNGKNEKPYTKEEKHPYTLVSGKKELSNADLPLGKAVDMGGVTEYKRPDGTQYLTNEILGQAIALILYNEKPMTPEDFLKEPVGTKAQVAKFAYSNSAPGNIIEALYPVILAQILEPGYTFEYCHQHGAEVQRSFKKFGQSEFRHAYQTFLATPITPIINTDTPGILSKAVYTGQRRVQLKENVGLRQSIGPGQKNCGSCTTYNFTTGLPPHHYIIP